MACAAQHIRNIAIIAHVDHGKTTLVDRMLVSAGAFRANQQVPERILDSNDQERERGITILAKNIAIEHRDVKINIIDTPGHADFGGEVERVVRMADGALLLVDAAEGPMPQTRFVLTCAIKAGLLIMIVINKIDKDAADPERTLDASLQLMDELGASDEQLDFAMEHVIYTSAARGTAGLSPLDQRPGMELLLDMIIAGMPAPAADAAAPLSMQVVSVDHSDYVGRIGVGRVYSGTMHAKDRLQVTKNDGSAELAQIKQLFTFNYLGRLECTEVCAGDICAVVGLETVDIGDVYTDPEHPVELDPIRIDPPTMAVVFEPSDSPLLGQEGDIVGGRQLKARLFAEAENNVTLKIAETDDKRGVEVSGRGVLHLSVLMETLRREGYEFMVGRPRVLFKKGPDGSRLEPYEEARVECASEYAGRIIELFGESQGIMTDMESSGERTNLGFKIPTRGIMGLKNRILNAAHGEAVFYHSFLEYGPEVQGLGERDRGSMISMTTEPAVAYALGTLQERGHLFIAPGDACYEGMIVGECNRGSDMTVNVGRTKHLGNQRSSTADIAVQLTPPVSFSLEEALEYIADDELLELTPKSIRMRKRLLSEIERRKWAVRTGRIKK